MKMSPTHLKMEDLFIKSKDQEINLPTVQRGFVWRPYQIEYLWDSLLRGYPIGAFVVSESKEKRGVLNLLDGQQRATALCLGFYNPLLSNGVNPVFRTSNENLMVFIDLDRSFKDRESQRKYVFRVITKSHPWGYQKTDNQKTLDSKSIGEALSKYFNGNSRLFNYDYLNQPLEKFWPFDSYRPVPFGLIIGAALKFKTLSELKSDIAKWEKSAFNYEPKCEEKLREDDGYLEEVFNDVKSMLEYQTIPLSYLDYERVFGTDSLKDVDDFDNELDDDVENLFIRLNSGGTAINGEELNYSILKSKISSELQQKIEDSCEGVLKPSRFITLVYQLYKNSLKPADGISLKVTPRRFQREMYKPKDFQLYIEKFIDDRVLKNVVDILRYRGDEDPGLPLQIIQSITARAPEVFFALLYRIYVKEDKIVDSFRPNVLGIITLFSWLGRGEKQRDHGKLLQNVWDAVKEFSLERFWSAETVQIAMKPVNMSEVLPSIPQIEDLNGIIAKAPRLDSLSKIKVLNDEGGKFKLFIEKVFYNKELLLFAQRKALKSWFGSIEHVSIEDSNIPFDWDHIVPQDLIKKKRHIRKELKEWFHSNGNFRAWPYSLNRSDNNLTPANKFSPNIEVSWVKAYMAQQEVDIHGLQMQLLSDSFCDKGWMECGVNTNFRDNRNAKKVLVKILERNIALCEHWYKQHNMGALIPPLLNDCDIQGFFKSFLEMRKWKVVEDEENVKCLLKIENEQFLFIEINSDNPLGNDAIAFGLMGENGSFGDVNSKGSCFFESDDEYDYIFNYFTLKSFFSQARIDLFEEFGRWVNNIPEEGFAKNIIETRFLNSLKLKEKNVN